MKTTEFKITQTLIPGLLEIEISKIEDARGYFQEKFQKEKLIAAGFPADFVPVQQNISFNKEKGVTRGLHAEPWDKYVTVISGKVFAAWVDLRKENFGQVYTTIIDETHALLVPRGVANAYQTQTENVFYSYLVNEHWKPDAIYKSLSLSDPALAIPWPIDLASAIISEKDQKHPLLKDIQPF